MCYMYSEFQLQYSVGHHRARLVCIIDPNANAWACTNHKLPAWVPTDVSTQLKSTVCQACMQPRAKGVLFHKGGFYFGVAYISTI
jgi:hypothetical protein